MQKEIDGLEKRKAWKVILKSILASNAKVLGARFVLTIIDEGTPQETWKARFVIQGHRDLMKQRLVHSTSLSKLRCTKIMLSFAVTNNFKLFSTDVTHACFPRTEKLNLKVFIQ